MKKNSVLIGILVVIMALVFCLTGCNDKEDNNYKDYGVYSEAIERVQKVKMLTGVNAVDNTQSNWDIGGTDLGFPYWDETRGKMYFLFGDTNHGINGGGQNWRSNIIGVSSDLKASDGIKFDEFISTDEKNAWATEIIPSVKDSNEAEGERTTIPTGGISIGGTHYIFYMSVRTWHTIGWEINYCGLVKSTDAKNFELVDDVFWSDSLVAGQDNTALLLEKTSDEVAAHEGKNFLQVFPYQVDDYVYLFGITNGRFGGCKLGRVKCDKIENFNEYEYYVGKSSDGTPKWIKGTAGLEELKDNDDSYIVEPQVGELCVSYNAYLKKYVMSFYCLDRIVMVTSENLIDWSSPEIVLSSNDVPILYGGFHHEKYNEDGGKVMYFFVSQYYGDFGDDAYNVQIVRVQFK